MPFEKFKARHGSNGPFEAFYDAATGGQGLFGRRGLKRERELTDSIIEGIARSEDFAGLAAVAEAGRTPMTREQHAEFRASLLQQALNQRTLEAGYQGFAAQQARLRESALPEDAEQLGVLESQAEYAFGLLRSAEPELRQLGASTMLGVLAAQRAFAITNEDQALQVKAAESADRAGERSRIQSFVDANVIAPLIEDQANYGSIRAQLLGEGSAVAPGSLVTAVLDYAGANLKQSEDGKWGFSLGPVSYQADALPPMTFSQLRNQLDAAHQGRVESMAGVLGQIGEQAKMRGFGVNGNEVSDLMFPLADRVFKAREREQAAAEPVTVPPEVDRAAATREGAEAAVTATEQTLEGLGRGLFPNFVRMGSDLLETLAPPPPEPPPPRRNRASGKIDRTRIHTGANQ